MRIGSMFSGVGGLDWAVECAFNATTAWQLDLVGGDVRRRHWPDALQVEADIRTVDPLSLPPIDVLCGGFPCVDLSCAGPQPDAPLDTGDRSGLYQEILRFTAALQPRYVVIENVPALVKHLPRVSRDFRALGYGLSWCLCRASDVGAPHLRRRVFILAERSGIGRGEVVADRREAGETWSTPAACNPNEGEDPAVWHARRAELAKRHGNNGAGEPLGQQVAVWPTVPARDYKTGDLNNRVGTPLLSQAISDYPRGTWGRRLNPDWVETLCGLPVGWTLPTGPRLEISPSPRWPRGRYPTTWDRSNPWPGYDWEPPRTLPDGPPCPGRPGRIRMLGNAVVPQQALLAIRAMI